MDLFSFFSRSPEKQIARARKKVKEPHGDPAVRMSAAQRLLEMKSPEALLALLDRFTINVSPSSRDEQEKLETLSWIVKTGDEAIEPLIKFLKQERQIYWPVRALRKILSEDEFSQKIGQVLRFHWEHPPASSDPKSQLIRLLEDVQSPQLLENVKPFLEDEADDTRLASLDYLFSYPEEETRQAIFQCYLDSVDRPRVRGYILGVISERQWSVRGFRPKIEESLPTGYTISRDGKIKSVGQIHTQRE